MANENDQLHPVRGQRLSLCPRVDGAPPGVRDSFAWDIAVGRRRIGQVILHDVDDHGGAYGISITAAGDRGRGYSTETTRLVLAYAFAVLHLPRVQLVVDARNRHAVACYTTCGFIPVLRWRDGRQATLAMLCPNPTLAGGAPLTRSLLLSPAAVRGRRIQLNRADLAFLGLRPGDAVAVALVGGDLLLQPALSPAADLVAVPVELSGGDYDQFLLAAAHLGLTPAALVSEVLTCSPRSATAA